MVLPTALNIDVAFEDFGVVLDELTSKPALFERDIERLRHTLYRQGGLNRRRAAQIFQANRIMQTCHNGWSEFYLEALTDFFLEYHDGRIALSAEPEKVLLTWLGDGATIDHANERRLALRICLKASNIPPLLEQRVLDAVSENLLHQSERWLGAGKRLAGVVDALDMQLVRRLVHGAGGQYPRRSHRSVIAFLLNLEQHVKQFIDAEGWRQLLIDCMVRHLVMDPLNGSEMDTAPEVEQKTRIMGLLGEGFTSGKAASLQNEILSAMLSMSDGCEEVLTARPKV